MPRTGKGQRVQTASGQQYGQAKAQEDAQAVVPLPQMQEPRAQPGEAPFARPSERPGELVTATAGMPTMSPPVTGDEQRFKIATMAAVLGEIASNPYASPHIRNTVRRLKSQVGNPADFADRGLPLNPGDS